MRITGSLMVSLFLFNGFFLTAQQLDNNLKVIDLKDVVGGLPLDALYSEQILWQTEDWEHSTWDNPNWPAGGDNTVGYPSVVYNDKGGNPDYKYYLFYAHHDPTSGIGCAVSETIAGPYIKLKDLPGSSRDDSQVLKNTHFPAPLGDPSHYSSPSLIWNEEEQLWFMYFHFYNHFWESWNGNGDGRQMTALATCPDLNLNEWTVFEDPIYGIQDDIVPVLPTTNETWMKVASSYSTIKRLPDGQWLAMMRGTPDDGSPTKIGIATSSNGRSWDYASQNPVIHQTDGGDGRQGLYRPGFVGYLGNGEYLCGWSESPAAGDVPGLIYGTTTNFIDFERDDRGYANLEIGDGFIDAWREDSLMYLFTGRTMHVMVLPVNTVTSVVETESRYNTVLDLFPNPATDFVNVRINQYTTAENYTVMILNALGMELYSEEISVPQLQIPVMAIGPPGLYFIRLDCAERKIEETRLLILH